MIRSKYTTGLASIGGALSRRHYKYAEWLHRQEFCSNFPGTRAIGHPDQAPRHSQAMGPAQFCTHSCMPLASAWGARCLIRLPQHPPHDHANTPTGIDMTGLPSVGLPCSSPRQCACFGLVREAPALCILISTQACAEHGVCCTSMAMALHRERLAWCCK